LIAAQAIYGDSFEVDTNTGSNITSIIQKAREIEQRYSFALFAADISQNAANASGLLYLDNDVSESEQYVYKIFANIPESAHSMDSGFVFVDPKIKVELPQIKELKAGFANQSVILSWNKSFYEDIYIGYFLEKSEDGVNFKAVDELPIINTESPTGKESRYFFKADSLQENYKTYHYRIRGIDAFGEKGPVSESISGQGYVSLDRSATIISADVINNTRINLRWEYLGEAEVDYFELERASKASGPFTTIRTNIGNAQRSITDSIPNTINYYRIKIVDRHGQFKSSQPYLAQLIDSLPPTKPMNVYGKVDSVGNVTLSWKQNTEDDLLGYRVFSSNFKSDEFSEITVDPLPDTTFNEKININTLTESIYYRIKAVDQHFNPSEYSEIIEIKRPDIYPPVTPIFKSVKSDEEGIQLGWINSTSADVTNHLLYRRKDTEPSWKLVAVFNNSRPDTTFVDYDVSYANYYEYTLIAVDDDGLESDPAKPVKSKRIDRGVRKIIEDVFVSADRKNQKIVLAWNYNEPGVERFIIYRGLADNPVSIYKAVSADQNQFEDLSLTVNSEYSYRIQAIYQGGAKSPLSETIKIKY
ncbi:MAG: hypothetical protein RLO81_14070, partial [Fulvivirga sp.]|uniref:hypothetical protein n=1 Tax=Fulvivirga sp. TaxID=1931237 RepID=UPI0032EE9709